MSAWQKAITSEVNNSLSDIDTLNQDILARFKGLNSLVTSLGNQVEEIAEYSYSAPISRVDFTRNAGWSTAQGWGTKLTVNVPIPNYRCYANIFASAQGYVYDVGAGGAIDQFFNGQCRVAIGGISSPEIAGGLCGPQGSEHWGLAMSHSAQLNLNGGGFVAITFDVYNGNNYQANQTDAALGVITTFTRAI